MAGLNSSITEESSESEESESEFSGEESGLTREEEKKEKPSQIDEAF